MIPLPVRSKRLQHRSIRAADRTLPDVSLLPMFDGTGRIQRLLLVMHDSRVVTMLDWRPGLIRVPWSGAVRLDAATDAFRPLSMLQASQAATLWHYDTAWLMCAGRFTQDEACIALKPTNCAGRLTAAVQSVYFLRNLSRVSMVSVAQAGGIQLGRWKAGLLPRRDNVIAASARTATSQPNARGWILDPIWYAGGNRGHC